MARAECTVGVTLTLSTEEAGALAGVLSLVNGDVGIAWTDDIYNALAETGVETLECSVNTGTVTDANVDISF